VDVVIDYEVLKHADIANVLRLARSLNVRIPLLSKRRSYDDWQDLVFRAVLREMRRSRRAASEEGP
jgi:hypothetical protein